MYAEDVSMTAATPDGDFFKNNLSKKEGKHSLALSKWGSMEKNMNIWYLAWCR